MTQEQAMKMVERDAASLRQLTQQEYVEWVARHERKHGHKPPKGTPWRSGSA